MKLQIKNKKFEALGERIEELIERIDKKNSKPFEETSKLEHTTINCEVLDSMTELESYKDKFADQMNISLLAAIALAVGQFVLLLIAAGIIEHSSVFLWITEGNGFIVQLVLGATMLMLIAYRVLLLSLHQRATKMQTTLYCQLSMQHRKSLYLRLLDIL